MFCVLSKIINTLLLKGNECILNQNVQGTQQLQVGQAVFKLCVKIVKILF